MTPTEVWIAPNTRKKILAMAQPAAIPDTISAPPRPLYTAVMTVSVSTQVISERKMMPDFRRIAKNSLRLTSKNCVILT